MNIWTFTGNLGKDAEVRYSAKGDAIAGFSVGVRSGYGEKSSTSWANCALFGKQAEALSPYLKKGQQVAVSGELTLRQYEGKNGSGQSLDVRVTSIDLIGKRDLSEAKESAKANGYQPGADEPDSEIPF